MLSALVWPKQSQDFWGHILPQNISPDKIGKFPFDQQLLRIRQREHICSLLQEKIILLQTSRLVEAFLETTNLFEQIENWTLETPVFWTW